MLYLVIAPPRTGKSQFAASIIAERASKGQLTYVTNYNQTDEQRAAYGCIDFPDAKVWWEEIPQGSTWIIDEAQDIMPQRGKNTPLPDWIKQFSKHGHHDLTIYVITQDAMQLDVHMRRNCNITYYMTRPLNMKKALIYTFRGYQEIPNDAWKRSRVLKTAEEKKKFTYRKRYQDIYISASAHDHIKMRFPKKLIILPVLVLITCATLYSGIKGMQSIASKKDNPDAPPAAAVIGAVAPTAAALDSIGDGYIPPTKPSVAVKSVMTRQEYANQFIARISDQPWSAPAYDQFQVKDYPRPQCVISDRGCRCWSQQMSLLHVSSAACIRFVKEGYFDPFREPVRSSPSPLAASSESVGSSSYAVGIGKSGHDGSQARYGQMRSDPVGADPQLYGGD